MYYILLIIGLVCCDQLLKWWVTLNVSRQGFASFLPGLIGITNLRNNGAAWSMLEGKQWFFAIVSVIAIIVIVFFMYSYRKQRIVMVSLSLILAGTLGNFIDRLRFGYVVDMFELLPINFPVFNIADICLTCGVLFLIIMVLFEKDEPKQNGRKTNSN